MGHALKAPIAVVKAIKAMAIVDHAVAKALAVALHMAITAIAMGPPSRRNARPR